MDCIKVILLSTFGKVSLSCCSTELTVNSPSAVSYTHLDVYKRQLQRVAELILMYHISMIGQESLNLSLIHILDVYKRQLIDDSIATNAKN